MVGLWTVSGRMASLRWEVHLLGTRKGSEAGGPRVGWKGRNGPRPACFLLPLLGAGSGHSSGWSTGLRLLEGPATGMGP